MEIGYSLSSEESSPKDLVRYARSAARRDQEGFFRFYQKEVLPQAKLKG